MGINVEKLKRDTEREERQHLKRLEKKEQKEKKNKKQLMLNLLIFFGYMNLI